MAETTQEFKPSLGLLDATMIVAGSMIGSGIFIVSADITRNVGSAGWLIAVWLITGFMTLTAALSYGELSAMFPKAGGQYVYLKEAYNPLAGFLYGWSFFAVIQTATIAAVGVAFSKFAGYFIPALELNDNNILFQLFGLKIYTAQIVSILLIVLLTWINTGGIKSGKVIQTVFTVVKLLSLFGLIVFGFLLAAKTEIWNANWQDAWGMKTRNADGSILSGVAGSAVLGAIAASMVGSIFSSDAWNNVTFIAGEIKEPQRNIPLGLFIGTGLVTIIYILANIAYLMLLPVKGDPNAVDALGKGIMFAQNDRVGTAALFTVFGNTSQYLMAALIMISTFGCNNGLILAGSRLFQSMAANDLFFSKAKELNSFGVPATALVMQAIWASVLCLSGSYGDLLDYATFASLIFYIVTITGLFVLRKKEPDTPRPYKAFGYPVIPLLYILLAGFICIDLLVFKTFNTGMGVLMILLGIPVFYLFNRKKAK